MRVYGSYLVNIEGFVIGYCYLFFDFNMFIIMDLKIIIKGTKLLL